MGKKKPTPARARKGLMIVASYYSEVEKPAENKNEEKPLKNDEIAVLSAGNNESTDNDNDYTIQMEKGTTMTPNTASMDKKNCLKLDKEKVKNKEEVESSGDEDEDGSLELNSEINDDKQQELHFNNGTEEATIMEADTKVINVEL